MGQKINPLGLRLGTTQRHHSLWFAKPKNYSKGLQEDQKIRDCIKNYVRDCVKNNVKGKKKPSDEAIISRIEIQKSMDVIKVVIYTSFPDLPKLLKEGKPQRIKELQTNVAKEFHSVNHKLNIAITIITKPYGQPTILAEYIAKQLKDKVAFRKAMKTAIELPIAEGNTKGIQVQIAGRIDGKEIARVEWIREGRVPLQTIRAKIDYCSYTVRMVYGVLGIKIWIFAGEE
uniref:ribosomal protein S3 n=1 Tax=Corydalis platycarpa TaxID=2975469 RepID=UPI00226D05DA|nr:ribosomal protein S3 [Corydalis platycarpa]YP_010711729.1 ribosomal protein S3 [Corydalis heterocarpa]YP_010712171.1 ribosomal protein S3 [Corydalis speciosa]UZM11188.1 ribosomal protein S3 [Corydalis platycarpa]WDA92384.1 ribosomal protein S3 [Corydalis heterocarpa]WDA92826.1 ribosomal protein S3 [Corydalis speciosa]WDA93286.1 ribosomal protein S3 [Corydalis platycarpa]